MAARKTIKDILAKKKSGEKITMLTAYDYPMASIIDEVGVDMILVGDSVANVVLGLESTLDVGMQEMIHHSKAVNRAVKSALVVGDMPFESYQKESRNAVLNAKRFIDEAGCDAVKLEWFDGCLEVVQAIIKEGIPVMGHVGLTPQTAEQLGGFKVQGKDADSARAIISHARSLEERGCFAIVLECIPSALAQIITEELIIPTIGIGAGPFCDGQVLVTHDILGLFDRFKPKFIKQYVNLKSQIFKGVESFCDEVKEGRFPDEKHSYFMDQKEAKNLKKGN